MSSVKPGDIVIHRTEQHIGTVLYVNKDHSAICVGKGRCGQTTGIVTVWPMQSIRNFHIVNKAFSKETGLIKKERFAIHGLLMLHRVRPFMKPIAIAKRTSRCKVFRPIPRKVVPVC